LKIQTNINYSHYKIVFTQNCLRSTQRSYKHPVCRIFHTYIKSTSSFLKVEKTSSVKIEVKFVLLNKTVLINLTRLKIPG